MTMHMHINPRSTLLALATALALASVSAGCRDQDTVEDDYNGRVAPGAEGVADDPVARTPADPALMPNSDGGMGGPQSGTMQGDAEVGDQGWRVGEDQATFLRGALASGEAEVAISRHVQDSATSQNVRDLARRIAEDHEALNGKLRDAGGATGTADGAATANDAGNDAAAQRGMDGARTAEPMMAEIRAKRGAEMERAYLTHMRDGHRKSIARYEAAAANGELAADVRALAEQALPTLREHFDAVQQALDQMR